MGLFGKFGKKKAERAYFDKRKGEDDPDNHSSKKEKPLGSLVAIKRRINKDLFVEVLRAMKSHDLGATVAVFANTTDNINKGTGVMINKGSMPQKIVTYLQETKLEHIEDALQHMNSEKPDKNGFYFVEDKLAAKLNVPANVMLYGIQYGTKGDFGMVLVFKKILKKPKDFIDKLNKTLRI